MPAVTKCVVNTSIVSSDAKDIDLLAILQNLVPILSYIVHFPSGRGCSKAVVFFNEQ